ncbi:2-dehydropantoate 2-reductase [Hydrogenophaga crassostreae]|uniref:2-dehydropantoate 2-reductase n=1 Tax=Hydrogenophaga crassostreae TaxID=1763535 RepID=A0A162W387_9BURK|nr:2-dehydropantoate 2-reductase [Hydrogenophaga crassostreae]AOW14459.1 2-dehydropantoate 2-reductase [Hydrogenophaga crassostreae]OAD43517.1 2-dehydropantoate 2-reductase [Hydrogenophaga crassostreae]
MKVCIVGAGAIGGWIGTRLAAAGIEVSAIARGATRASLQEHGWRLQTAEGPIQAPVAGVSEHAEDLGIQDLVVIAVKGPALTTVAAGLKPLLGEQTTVLPAMNGVPWWFCRGLAEFGEPLQSVDAGGVINTAIPFEQVMGCVVHASTATTEPGLVKHKGGNGLIVGEASGGDSDRSTRVVELLKRGGFDVTHSENIRQDIWYKLWGNLTMNPVSALTGATIDRILADELVRNFCSEAMEEAKLIGERIGCAIGESPEARHAITAKLGAFKTSMLQDVEAHRQLELDAIVGVVFEMGNRLGIPLPNIGALLGLSRLMARERGLYPDAPI